MKIDNIKNAIVYNKESIKLLKKRQLKEIISPDFLRLTEGENIFICDKEKIHAIIILNKAHTLNKEQLNNHSNRHGIPEKDIDELWNNVKKFNVHSFRIKKVFKEPFNYTYKGKETLQMSKLIKNVTILEKGVIPFREYVLDPIDSEWNGPEEIKKASIETLSRISTWFNKDKPNVKSSYKLPHHRAEVSKDHATVFRGVAAAMGSLLGARGGVNIPEKDRLGVYTHLSKHYKEFDKEVPVFKGYSVEELKSIFPELYKDILLYEERLELLKNIEVSESKKIIKELILELYSLFIKRLSEKKQNNSDRPKDKSQHNEGKKKKPKNNKKSITKEIIKENNMEIIYV